MCYCSAQACPGSHCEFSFWLQQSLKQTAPGQARRTAAAASNTLRQALASCPQAAQLEALLSTSQLESCSLKKELQRKDKELQRLQEQLRDAQEALQGARQGKEDVQKESETQVGPQLRLRERSRH